MKAVCVVHASGILLEEVSYFDTGCCPFSVACIRTSTERPEAIDKGNFILGNITIEPVIQTVDRVVKMNEADDL